MKNNVVEIPENVNKFIQKCSDIYGRFESESFYMGIDLEISHLQVESPIEQLLLSSLRLISELSLLNLEIIQDIPCGFLGLKITPQYEIEKFRVDFFVEYSDGTNLNQLVVECDSQQFHDRSERERRYEKSRERFLVSRGYKIFRYTGSEILNNSIQTAIEIISQVSGFPKKIFVKNYEDYLE